MRHILFMVTLCFCAAGAWAGELLLDSCTAGQNWQFSPGGEFPGAGGYLAYDPGAERLVIGYDFTHGGRYVAAGTNRMIPAGTEKLTLTVTPGKEVSVAMRLTDATGRTFQTHAVRIPAGESSDLALTAQESWNSIWGGDENSTVPAAPWQTLWLMVNADEALGPAGIIRLEALTAEGTALSPAPFSGENFSGVLGDAAWTGRWIPCAEGAQLETRFTAGKEDLSVEFDFPMNGRSRFFRRSIPAGESAVMSLPFPALNPRNVYQVRLAVKDGLNESRSTLKLTGAEADDFFFGVPRTSSEIPTYRFGSAVHFNFGQDPLGPFRGWHYWRTLIDDMALCGMKYIRDSVTPVQDPETGRYRVSDWDREWIEYARSKDLAVIVHFHMIAGRDAEEFGRECADLAMDLDGLVDVFEIGNEPNNFGGWRETYGGPWNGKEPDNSTSPWVLENLKHANAAALAIKAVRPDVQVIGTGACSPTNIRYLDAGLTPAMDGIVDHPYSFSLPPEKVPFGKLLIERDGIDIGDEGHTFVGLMNSYMDHFRRTGVERTLWLTEFGFPTNHFNGRNETVLYGAFSEPAQASYLLRRQLQVLGLPFVKACTPYDYMDDYQSEAHEAEANFGLRRADGSHKQSWYALQRFNSLLADTVPAEVAVAVTAQPLHRSMERGVLVKDWDSAAFTADNEVLFQALINPFRPQDRLLAIWSAQPYSGEFTNRAVSLEVDGWGDASLPLTAIDLATGRSYDVPARAENGKVIIDLLELANNPVLLCF